MNTSENTEKADQKKKRKHFGWSRLSYARRLTISFAAIAAMTALVAIGVLSFVWDQHFQTYTNQNIQTVADKTAEQIAEKYKKAGEWTAATVDPAGYASEFHHVRIMIFKSDDPTRPPNEPIYDSANIDFGTGSVVTAPDPPAGAQTITAGIVAEDTEGENVEIGYVRVYINSSDTLLTSTDERFRENSYQAMIFATVLAIVLALCIGFLFARNLVNPINRVMRAAEEIKEGNLAARTKLMGDDEIARLGKTFDAMAESVEKDRELERRLTTDVAHELRTPLMAIQSTVEAMVDGVFMPDTERLETVNSEVQRLSRLVDALLRLSRLENRSTPMKEEVVDVGVLIAGIVATHEAYVNESGLSLEFQADKNACVYGDADMIRQATANLISNAVRYTPEGGHITVQVKKGDIMVRISVQDTGIGLTAEEAKMVFSRFWRAEAGRNREYGGLGVGLAVVKEIVDRHGGWVHVEGKPDQGATFTIYIPLYNEANVKSRIRNKDKRQKRL